MASLTSYPTVPRLSGWPIDTRSCSTHVQSSSRLPHRSGLHSGRQSSAPVTNTTLLAPSVGASPKALSFLCLWTLFSPMQRVSTRSRANGLLFSAVLAIVVASSVESFFIGVVDETQPGEAHISLLDHCKRDHRCSCRHSRLLWTIFWRCSSRSIAFFSNHRQHRRDQSPVQLLSILSSSRSISRASIPSTELDTHLTTPRESLSERERLSISPSPATTDTTKTSESVHFVNSIIHSLTIECRANSSFDTTLTTASSVLCSSSTGIMALVDTPSFLHSLGRRCLEVLVRLDSLLDRRKDLEVSSSHPSSPAPFSRALHRRR